MGDQAEIRRQGQDALKLYRVGLPKSLASQEAAALAVAEAVGVPAPRLRGKVQMIEGRWGFAMNWVEGPTFGAALYSGAAPDPDYLQAMASLHFSVHTQHAPELPNMKGRLGEEIHKAAAKGELNSEQGSALLEELGKAPDSKHFCHGDFHADNIIGRPGSAWIVDWPSAAHGDPLFDVCQSYMLMQRRHPALALAYVEAYAGKSGLVADDILGAGLPVVAGARLADNVPDEVATLKKMVDGTFLWRP